MKRSYKISLATFGMNYQGKCILKFRLSSVEIPQPFYNLTLHKAPQGVNVINILRAHFLYKSASLSFSVVTFWLWQKDFGEKKNFRTKNAHAKC